MVFRSLNIFRILPSRIAPLLVCMSVAMVKELTQNEVVLILVLVITLLPVLGSHPLLTPDIGAVEILKEEHLH